MSKSFYYSESEEICDVSKNFIVFVFLTLAFWFPSGGGFDKAGDGGTGTGRFFTSFGRPIDLSSCSGPFNFNCGFSGVFSGSFFFALERKS